MRVLARGLCFALLAQGARVASAHGQDLFVLEAYRPVIERADRWEGELHLNYVAQGPAATAQHYHAALELSHAVTNTLTLAGYALVGRRPGLAPEVGGWRLRALVAAPGRWRLPIRVGFVGELEYTRPAFSDHRFALELVPLFNVAGRRWDIAFNPGIELEFPTAHIGAEVEWEPSARVAYQVSTGITATVEYYAILGEVTDPLPVVKQIHQFYPGLDVRLGEDVTWNVGLGVGVTSAGNRLTLKTRFEVPLER
jgi:hypothetical protein